MRIRKAFQVILFAAAVVIGISQPVFNGLSLLSLLALMGVLLLQPGVMLRLAK